MVETRMGGNKSIEIIGYIKVYYKDDFFWVELMRNKWHCFGIFYRYAFTCEKNVSKGVYIKLWKCGSADR